MTYVAARHRIVQYTIAALILRLEPTAHFYSRPVTVRFVSRSFKNALSRPWGEFLEELYINYRMDGSDDRLSADHDDYMRTMDNRVVKRMVEDLKNVCNFRRDLLL